MSKYFYSGYLNTKDSCVIYKYNPDEIQADLILADGYIESAKIIIQQIKNNHNSLGPQHDQLIYPLLNIYCSALEFLLKSSIKYLIKHKEREQCKFLNHTSQSIKKALNSHEIDALFTIFRELINNSNPQHPHNFDDLYFLSDIIDEFINNDINCYSTRYHQERFPRDDKPPQVYNLYKKQQNVRLYLLHEHIEKIADSFQNYVNNENFNLCAQNCFSTFGLERLKEILFLSNRNKDLFQSLIKKNNCTQQNSGAFFVSSINEEIHLEHSPEEIKFFDNIKKLPITEQNALLKCLYLGSRPLETVGLDYDFPQKQVSEKIYEYKHQYKNGIKKLKEYINYVTYFSSFY